MVNIARQEAKAMMMVSVMRAADAAAVVIMSEPIIAEIAEEIIAAAETMTGAEVTADTAGTTANSIC